MVKAIKLYLQFNMSLCVKQDILWLQVTIDDSQWVQMFQGKHYFIQVEATKKNIQ